jgi:hypothetical protein
MKISFGKWLPATLVAFVLVSFAMIAYDSAAGAVEAVAVAVAVAVVVVAAPMGRLEPAGARR